MTELHVLVETLLNRGFLQKNKKILTKVLVAITFVSSIALCVNNVDFKGVHFRKAVQSSVPEYAVDFIEGNRLPGNIYNDFVFGGYVIWRLYPWKKNFIDTRAINYTVLSEARWINFAQVSLNNSVSPANKPPLWERILDHYDIDIMLLDTLNVHGSLAPILLELLENNKWVPVYVDLISVVFVRDKENNRSVIEKHRIKKETVFTSIITRAIQGALKHRNNPNFLISLGTIFYNMGKMKDAVAAYEYAIKRLPKNNPLRIRIEEIKKEMDSENAKKSPPQ